jgi:signal transduction histidine kinase
MVLGFGACIAAILAIQATAVLLWLRTLPDDRRLSAFTHEVADDLGDALERTPDMDAQRYIDEKYPKPLASLYVVLQRNQQVVLRGPVKPPPADIAGAREFWSRTPAAVPDSWITGPYQVSPIVANGQLAGGVGVIVVRSWQQAIGGRTIALSIALLVVGTAIAGLFIFGSVRARLIDLEEAAHRFGGGDFGARAVAAGDDELTALAAAFNRMAEDLGARDRLLKESDQARRMLLADVSHELMTPLTAIRAYREVLAMSDIVKDPEASRCLSVIADEAERLERVVGDLLDLARLEAGGKSLNPEDVSVENLFGRVAARHEPEAKLKSVTLTTSVGSGAEVLFGDSMRLEQALQNLAANALRHTPPGGEVELRAETSGDQLFLSVLDTGTGIAVEHLPFVFDRFYKTDRARTGGAAGSGLGLSIVKAIVERHGGSVSVTSEPGHATVFTIRLPLGLEAASAPGLFAAPMPQGVEG